MINKKTTFILGAGASTPYGFPLGVELLYLIRNKGAFRFPDLMLMFSKAFPEEGSPREIEEKYNNMINDLNRADPPSIDHFLTIEKQRKYLKLGKFTIAFLLNSRDNTNQPKSRIIDNNHKQDSHWYKIVMEKITDGHPIRKHTLMNSNLSFITFNYDTSLEEYFYDVANQSLENEAEIKEFFNQFPIVHVHGRLKVFPWEERSSNNVVINNTATTPEQFKAMSERLLLPNEENKENHYEQYFENADKVIFLGFGFNTNNLDKIGLKNGDLLKVPSCFSNSMDFSEARKTEILLKLETDENQDPIKFIQGNCSRLFDLVPMI